MTLVVMQRDAVPIGYRIESVWGTDPLSGNLAVLGVVRSCKVSVRQNREPQRGVGAGVDPKLFRRKGLQVTIDLEYEVQDDNPANSFLGLALGDAPNAGTGVIVNRPNGTNKNLRSFTMEVGFDWPATDEYWQVTGCMVRRLEDRWADDTFVRKLNIQGKVVAAPTSAPAVAPPSLSALSMFDPYAEGSVTFTNPSVANHVETDFAFIVENALKGAGIVGGGRGLGYLQIAGRNVFAEVNTLKAGSDFVTQFFAAPNAAAAQVDVTATVSKSSGAEYVSYALTDCEIVGDSGPEYADSDDEVKESWRFQAKAYACDVKV